MKPALTSALTPAASIMKVDVSKVSNPSGLGSPSEMSRTFDISETLYDHLKTKNWFPGNHAAPQNAPMLKIGKDFKALAIAAKTSQSFSKNFSFT